MPLPHYYSRLEPFRSLFASGRPVLTYHHVGPRRRGARLKGLYVSPKLFARQMAELKAERFATTDPGAATAPGPGGGRRIVVTFDDGFRDVFQHALPVLRAHGFCAIEFLVANALGQTNRWQQRDGDVVERLADGAQVRDWLAAGQQIGSHSLSHPHLTRLSLRDAQEEITASKRKLEDLFGVPVRHFCYPYGDWNPAVRDLVGEAGYETACTTQTGINPPGADPLTLKRFTARYPSRNWKNLRAWVTSKLMGEGP